MNISYKGQPLAPNFIAGLVAYGKTIIELKTVGRLGPIEAAQILNYL